MKERLIRLDASLVGSATGGSHRAQLWRVRSCESQNTNTATAVLSQAHPDLLHEVAGPTPAQDERMPRSTTVTSREQGARALKENKT